MVERVLNWARIKSQSQLNKKQGGSKHSRLRGIPKLDDANEAGGKNALDCTLIVTEGDSAKSLAVSGLGVIGRDNYGVFPLRGKLLNVREASHAQVWNGMEADVEWVVDAGFFLFLHWGWDLMMYLLLHHDMKSINIDYAIASNASCHPFR